MPTTTKVPAPRAGPDAWGAAAAGASALDTYEAFAPFYDAFTADYQYESWMADLEAWAREEGLRGRRALDVACGTGSSFMPLLRRGYEVTGCDLSPAMVERARAKSGGQAEVVVADARALPWRDEFDLVTCVDDSLNYLLTTADLIAALRCIGAALRPGGLAAFDVNSLAAYRSGFASDFPLRSEGISFRWRGEGDPSMPPGGMAAATIEVEGPDGPTAATRHVQRHHPVESVVLACEEAGLRIVGIRGELPGEGLVPGPDEEAHTKIVFLATRTREGEEVIA